MSKSPSTSEGLGRNSKNEPDPQLLLPEPFRSSWIVIPKDALYQAVLVGCLFGSGLALSIVGYTTEIQWMRWTPAVTLLALFLQHKCIPWSEKRLLKDLAERRS